MATEKTYSTQQLKKAADNRAANPYEQGTRYYDMYENNPYTADTFTREQTFWDRVANAFGMRSGYDAALDEWLKAGTEYDAQINQIKGEDEYNSAEAQAARERAAGINPDLVGLQGEPAAEFAQEQTTPNVNAVNEQANQVGNLVQGIVQATMQAIGMTGDIAKTIGVIENIRKTKLDNAKQLEELVEPFLENYTPERQGKYDDENTLIGELTGFADLFAENHRLNKRQKAQFTNAVLAAYGSKKGMIYDRDTKTLRQRQEYGIARGSRYTTTSNEVDQILKTVGTLTNKIDSTYLHTIEANNAQAKYEKDYYSNLDGVKQAESENTQFEAEKGLAEMKKNVREAINTASYELGKMAKEGSIGAAILQALLPGLFLKFADTKTSLNFGRNRIIKDINVNK